MDESNFQGIEYDFVEYYVGMAKMVVYWHVKALGFRVLAMSAEGGDSEDKVSYLIEKNNIRLLITAPISPASHKITSFINQHGNAIKRIAVRVEDVETQFNTVVEKGGIPIETPKRMVDQDGEVGYASVKLFDDNEVVFVDYSRYKGVFMPGFIESKEDLFQAEDTLLLKIDHIACALRYNESKIWETYFNNLFNSKTVKLFNERQEYNSHLEKQNIGMMLKVLQSQDKKLNNVLVEPDAYKSTQVKTFIEENHGAGIQHIAFESSNIFRTVELLRQNGIRFTKYPEAYYNNLQKKYFHIDVEALKKYGILCDVKDGALLLQVFTSPIGDRNTFFYEIIQRVDNYDGFGLDNITALFEAMEVELLNKVNF